MEVSVTPPQNKLFYVPNDNGDYPETGVKGDALKAGGANDNAPTSMHNY